MNRRLFLAAAASATIAGAVRGQQAAVFSLSGELTQGGWLRGQAPAGATAVRLGSEQLALDPVAGFFAAFDRDAAGGALLSASMPGGRLLSHEVAIAPRAWQIEHVNVARRPGGTSDEQFLAIRQPELARIAAARGLDTGSRGWTQAFAWPSPGRISGRFGAQRVYKGEPAAYHSGLDLAGGAGTIFTAPADGVIVLAATQPFSLEGHLIIVDHGQGLNSAFLHASEILVREGQAVRQGEPLGRIGATGRATGPHLHWSMKWREARLDPLLFLPPRT